MPPKISRHGGASYEQEPVRVRRPGIVPGATDRTGDELELVGNNSEPSSENPPTKSEDSSASLPSPAPTTESPLSPTEPESSDADSTDTSTLETETESAKSDAKRIPNKKTAPTRRANIRTVGEDDFA